MSTELIARMRTLEADHEPDGWPAVRMRDISALCDAVERCGAGAGCCAQAIEIERLSAALSAIYEAGRMSDEVRATYMADIAAAALNLPPNCEAKPTGAVGDRSA